jgi:hypothetical protein
LEIAVPMHGDEGGVAAAVAVGEELLKPLETAFVTCDCWSPELDAVGAKGCNVCHPASGGTLWRHLAASRGECAIGLVERHYV